MTPKDLNEIRKATDDAAEYVIASLPNQDVGFACRAVALFANIALLNLYGEQHKTEEAA